MGAVNRYGCQHRHTGRTDPTPSSHPTTSAAAVTVLRRRGQPNSMITARFLTGSAHRSDPTDRPVRPYRHPLLPTRSDTNGRLMIGLPEQPLHRPSRDHIPTCAGHLNTRPRSDLLTRDRYQPLRHPHRPRRNNHRLSPRLIG